MEECLAWALVITLAVALATVVINSVRIGGQDDRIGDLMMQVSDNRRSIMRIKEKD